MLRNNKCTLATPCKVIYNLRPIFSHTREYLTEGLHVDCLFIFYKRVRSMNMYNIFIQVFEEQQSIFSIGDHNRPVTYNDLIQMEYLERVIKETLRIFPPLPVFGRDLDEEMIIGDYVCPAGMIYFLMRDSVHIILRCRQVSDNVTVVLSPVHTIS